MKIIFLILLISLPCSLSFDCPDIDKKSFCNSAQGCEWSEGTSKCDGDIENLTICEDSNCIFIWNNTVKKTKEEQDGSLQNPYTSFTKAFKSLDSSKDYHLIAINVNQSEYELKSYNFSQKSITIQPFFDQDQVKLSLNAQIDNIFRLTNETKLIIQNTRLVIDQENASSDQNISIFSDITNNVEIVKPQCQLSILNTNIEFKDVRDEETNSQFVNFQFCNFLMENSNITSRNVFRIIQLLAIENLERKPKIELKNFNYIFYSSKQLLSTENAEVKIENTNIIQNQTHNMGSLENIYLFFIQNSELNVHNLTIHKTKSNTFYLKDSQVNFNQSKFIDNVAYKVINIPPHSKNGIRRANFTSVDFKGTKVKQQILYLGVNVYLSQIKMDNVKFYFPSYTSYIQTGVCLLSYFSRVEIEDSTFSNFEDTCIYLHYSSLDIKNSIYYGNKTSRSSMEFYADSGFIPTTTIVGSIIAISSSKYVQDSKYPYTQNITIKNTQFLAFPNFANSGGALLSDYQTHSKRYINIIDCIFLGILAIEDGGSVQTMTNDKAIIQSSIFSNHGYKKLKKLAGSGGALSIYSSTIQSCIFTNLQSNSYGGAIESYQNELKDNIFHQNTALFGGALAIDFYKNQLKGANYFVFNQAKVRGGVIFYSGDGADENQQNSTTYPNFDEKGLSFNYTMQKPSCIVNKYKFNSNWNLMEKDLDFKKLIESDKGIFEKLETFQCSQHQISMPTVNISYKYGNFYRELIEIILTENYTGEVNQDFNGLDLCLTIENYDYNLLRECEKINTGKAYFSGIDMSINVPNFTNFKESMQKEVIGFVEILMGQVLKKESLFVKFSTNIEFCGEGDHIIDEVNGTCEPCPQYTYSLKVPKFLNDTCLPCPDNMVCAGGNDVLPLPGYYRPSLSSTKAVECLNEIACIGGIIEDQVISRNGFCKDKFSGVLCSQCEPGYIPSQNSQSCIQCENDVFFYLKMIGIMFITLGIVLVQIYLKFKNSQKMASAYQENNKELLQSFEKTNSFSNSFKIIVTLLQMISIIKAINFQWIASLKHFYNLSSDILPTIVKQFAQRCLLVFLGIDAAKMQYYQYIMVLSTPFINLFWISIIAIIYFLIKRRGRSNSNADSQQNFSLKSVLFQAIIILFYIYQPSILIETFNLFSCRQLGDKYFFIQNLDVECYDSTYFKWVFILGIPSLFFWALFIPISLYFKIKKEFTSAFQDGNEELNLFRSKYSFIVSSYKSEYYYWEFLVTLRKIAMILLVSLLALSDNMTQGITVSIIIGISMYIQLKYTPYTNESLSKLDKASMMAILVMIQLGIYMENETIIKNGQIITNNAFIIYILSLIGAFLLIYCCLLFVELVYKAYWGKVKDKVSDLLKNKKDSIEFQESTIMSKKESSVVL